VLRDVTSTYEAGDWRRLVAAAESAEPALVATTSALVVVDVQRKSCDRTTERGLAAWLRESNPAAAEKYFDRLEQVVVPNIERLLAAFRARHLVVLHFLVGPRRLDAGDLPFAFRYRYRASGGEGDSGLIHAGSPEFEPLPQVAPGPEEIVIHKTTYGGLTGTGAESLLRNLGVESLVLCGGTAHICVESTGRTAADLGFRVVAVEDAIVDYDPLFFDTSMATFATLLGRVLPTDRVLEEIAAS
jgi:nicotinamidase-related amidase